MVGLERKQSGRALAYRPPGFIPQWSQWPPKPARSDPTYRAGVSCEYCWIWPKCQNTNESVMTRQILFLHVSHCQWRLQIPPAMETLGGQRSWMVQLGWFCVFACSAKLKSVLQNDATANPLTCGSFLIWNITALGKAVLPTEISIFSNPYIRSVETKEKWWLCHLMAVTQWLSPGHRLLLGGKQPEFL